MVKKVIPCLLHVLKKLFIGTKQISLAIATNILCSLLFFVYSVRTGIKKGEVWYIQMPWEGIIALFVLIVLCLYLFHIKRKK